MCSLQILRSEVSFDDISDGTSQTIMLGEKYLMPDNYSTGTDPGDNWHLFHEFDSDSFRYGSPWSSARSVRFNYDMESDLIAVYCNCNSGMVLREQE